MLDAYTLNELKWDSLEKVYRFPNGRLVSKPQLFATIKRENDGLAKRLAQNLDSLIRGQISLEDWQRQSATAIKEGHLKMARFGRGGRDNTFAYHNFQVGSHLRTTEYPALRRFATDLKNGKLTEKQAIARIKRYAYSTKVSYEMAALSVKADTGEEWGRRRLGSCLNHCNPCIKHALAGWMPLSQVVIPGTRCDCGPHCCCSVETRRYPPMEEFRGQ